MLIYFLFSLSISTISPVTLEIGRNIVSLSVNQQIEIKEVDPLTYFIFLRPISKNVEIIVESNEGVLGNIQNDNVGVFFGANSGKVVFRHIGDQATQESVDFYYLASSSNASQSYLSTFSKDAFVISQTNSFSTCRKFRQNHPIEYWHVTGRPQKLVSSSNKANPANTVLFAYEKIPDNKINANSTEPVTLSTNGPIYFLWNAQHYNRKGSYKLSISPDESNFESKSPEITKMRYEFSTKSITQMLKANHNYGEYLKFERLGQPVPLEQLEFEDYDKQKNSNVIQLSFEPSILTLLFSLIGIIVILLCILIYVGLMPVPSSSSILNQKTPNDEESLLKDSEKSPELAVFLGSNR